MKNPYTYTKHFVKPIYNSPEKILLGYVTDAFNNLRSTLDKYPLGSECIVIMEETFFFSYPRKLSQGHLRILKPLGELLMVKVMYHDVVYMGDTAKGFKFIGDMDKIRVISHIWDYLIHIIDLYNEGLLKSGNGKFNSSLLNYDFMIVISKTISKLLEKGKTNTYELEKFIMNRYKLKYKNYNTQDVLYFHAVSPKYHHNMMLL